MKNCVFGKYRVPRKLQKIVFYFMVQVGHFLYISSILRYRPSDTFVVPVNLSFSERRRINSVQENECGEFFFWRFGRNYQSFGPFNFPNIWF